MINSVKQEILKLLKQSKIKRNLSIQLAYSGGMDSSCLLDILLKLKKELKFKLFLSYMNYQSSSYSSDVMTYINSGFFNDVVKVTKNTNIQSSCNFESEARKRRYDFFNKNSQKYNIDYTFTAHHLNDQMETLVMKFIDGSDFISMQGIRKKIDNIYRPMLKIKKSEIEDYVNKNKIIYFEDPTNADISFLRNKVRKIIMPSILMDSFLFSKIQCLHDEATLQVQRAQDIMDEELRNTIIQYSTNPKFLSLKLKKIRNYDILFFKLYFKSIIKIYFKEREYNRSKSFWLELLKFANNAKVGAAFPISDKIELLKDRESLFLFDKNELISLNNKKIKLKKSSRWPLGKIDVSQENSKKLKNKYECLIDKNEFNRGIFIRNWKYGDKVFINNIHKKVSDLLINHKVPLFKKSFYPIVEDSQGEIVWIPGIFCKQYDFISNHILLKWRD